MKTLMVSFQPKWAQMILSGKKKYEFRQGNFVNAKTGDKFLILESKGKKKSISSIVKYPKYHMSDCRYEECIYEGTGKVIGEFIVGEIYDDIKNFVYLKSTYKNPAYKIWETLEKQGYDNQKLAFEITQLKVYDTPRDKSEYMLYNPLNDWLSNTIDLVDEEQMYATKEYAIRKNMFRITRSPQSFCRVIDTV
jgi:hypothetical protein